MEVTPIFELLLSNYNIFRVEIAHNVFDQLIFTIPVFLRRVGFDMRVVCTENSQNL